jgi:hypothetical protein
MLLETKILKDNQLLSGEDIMDGTKDGESSMLIKPRRSQERDGTTNSASISIDNSTLDQDFQ